MTITTIPHAYSVRQEDFDPDLGKKLMVRLNNEPVTKCIAYDMDKGFVIRYKTDKDGRIILSEDKESAEEEILYGEVTVELTG